MTTTTLKWMCDICKSIQISKSNERHTMDYCECKKTAVDLEEWYQRNMGKVVEIDRNVIEN